MFVYIVAGSSARKEIIGVFNTIRNIWMRWVAHPTGACAHMLCARRGMLCGKTIQCGRRGFLVWDAWYSVRGTSQADAKASYVKAIIDQCSQFGREAALVAFIESKK